MTNYICINGKKAELTEEQLKALGIELPKASPFNRADENECAYYIEYYGEVREIIESTVENYTCSELHDVANYCTDKSIMEQRALHETLNRLLWRYSMEHDGDKINWDDPNSTKWFIYYNHNLGCFCAHNKWDYEYLGTVPFRMMETAEAAITEIVKPFMKAHPEFKW